MKIEIVNWSRYNPRSDRKKHTWFRLENNIATSSGLFKLSCSQRFVAVCLLAEVSKNGGDPTPVDTSWLAFQLKIKESEIIETIQLLADSGVLRSPAVTDKHTTNERTNERTNDRVDLKKSGSLSTNVDPLLLFDLWNSRCGSLPKAKEFSVRRRKAAKARLHEHPSLDEWSRAIDGLAKSAFATGANDRGWRADFDFLLKPDSIVKILEGKYDNKKIKSSGRVEEPGV